MDRTIQPEIQALKNFHILSPVRTTLPNGVPLTVVNAGEQEVVRMDILFAGGRWQQSQKKAGYRTFTVKGRLRHG